MKRNFDHVRQSLTISLDRRETTLKKIVICPECHGHGEVRVGNLRENHNLDTEPCGQCGGKKLLRRIVTINYEQL